MSGQPSDIPLGLCPKCNMPIISQEGVSICPSCDTKNKIKSGLVNNYADPGKSMDKDGRIAGGVKQMDNIQIGVAKVSNLHQQSTDALPLDPLDLISYHISRLDSVLADMKLSDFSDLREARKVMKYRKKLAVLKVELQDLIG